MNKALERCLANHARQLAKTRTAKAKVSEERGPRQQEVARFLGERSSRRPRRDRALAGRVLQRRHGRIVGAAVAARSAAAYVCVACGSRPGSGRDAARTCFNWPERPLLAGAGRRDRLGLAAAGIRCRVVGPGAHTARPRRGVLRQPRQQRGAADPVHGARGAAPAPAHPLQGRRFTSSRCSAGRSTWPASCRSSGSSARRSMQAILQGGGGGPRAGNSFLVFPEGTRSRTGRAPARSSPACFLIAEQGPAHRWCRWRFRARARPCARGSPDGAGR